MLLGGAYLQVIAAAARVDAARAQLDTANALYKQTSDQRSVGLVDRRIGPSAHGAASFGQRRLRGGRIGLAFRRDQ